MKASSLVLLVMLAGCARLTLLTSDDLAASIEAARAEKDFRTARYLIDATPDSHPQYTLIRKQADLLDTDIAQYEKRSNREVLSLARAGEWQAAHQLLDEAQGRLPDSALLAQTASTLAQREELVAAQASSTLLLAEARWLADHAVQRTTLESLTLSDARRQHRDLERRRQAVREDMDALGAWFGERQDWQRTFDLLYLSRQLADNPEPAGQLEQKAKQALSSASYREQQQLARKQRQQASSLLATYQKSQALDDLLKARDYIKAHAGALESLDQEITQICQRVLQDGMSEGERLYAKGEYRPARQQWLRVLPIAPDHPELNKKLQRVDRVLQSLEALQGN